jgi:hypothetical protein
MQDLIQSTTCKGLGALRNRCRDGLGCLPLFLCLIFVRLCLEMDMSMSKRGAATCQLLEGLLEHKRSCFICMLTAIEGARISSSSVPTSAEVG